MIRLWLTLGAAGILAASPARAQDLTPPRLEALERIVRGPFVEHPGMFGTEISSELAVSLQAAIAERCESGPRSSRFMLV